MLEGKGSVRGLVPTSSYGVRDEAYNEYLGGIDPRGDGPKSAAVRAALAQATDIRFREFLERAMDPRCANWSLAAIAKERVIAYHEMADFWNKAQHARALTIAQDGIVDVMEDIVYDARTKQTPCDRCDGFGVVYVEDGMAKFDESIEKLDPQDPKSRSIRTCPMCAGHGTMRKMGDVDARRQLLETTGYTGKKSSAAGVQIVQHFGGMGMESAVDKLNKISFDVDYEEVREDGAPE